MRKYTLFLLILQLAFFTNAQKRRDRGVEYADIILDAYYSGVNKNFTQLYGGFGERFPIPISPNVILGNKKGFLSLPKDSYVILGFTDNSIIDAPNQKDLFIEELGGSGELANVYVSADAKVFTFLGTAKDNGTTAFDLADIGYKEPVIAIKIIGLDNRGASPGFDIKSVKAMKGAIGKPNENINLKLLKGTKKKPFKYTQVEKKEKKTIKAKEITPIESTNNIKKTAEKKVVNGLIVPNKFKKIIKFDQIFFEYKKFELSEKARKSLDMVIGLLEANPNIRIKLIGHTDNHGDEDKNQNLSLKRVGEVKKYLVSKGINTTRIDLEAQGENTPIADNQTDKGRALNRRVGISIVD